MLPSIFWEPAEQYSALNSILRETVAYDEVRFLLLDESSFYQQLMSLGCTSSAEKREGICCFTWLEHLSSCCATGSAFLVIGLIAKGHPLWSCCSSPLSCWNDINLSIYHKVTGRAVWDIDGLFHYVVMLRCNAFYVLNFSDLGILK